MSTGCRWCRVQGLTVSCGVCSVPLSLPFVPLLLLLSCNTCKICLISRFKGVFRGFWGADVYSYGLRALRGLWGFCVREWLGGYIACGDFLQNLSFCPFVFLSCSAFVACFPWLPALLALLLFWLCGLVCLLGWVVGFLSLSDGFRHKKKGRKVFLRPLLSCCGLV